MTGWDTRAQAGLRSPRAISTNINPTAGVGGHYGGAGPFKRADHAACRAIWRSWQDFHMSPSNLNNYNDIAYSLGVCHHDIVLEGRSTRSRPIVRGGANGNATVNGNRYSVVAIWGSNDGDWPPSLRRAWRFARDWLRQQDRRTGTGITPHRDMSSTACPGGPGTAWMRAGAPIPGGSTPPPPTSGGDDMAISNADAEKIAHAVWNRENPTLDLTYGGILRFVFNRAAPDRSPQSTKHTLARQVWDYNTVAHPTVRGRMLREAWISGHALEDVLEAQRPLLAAAAEGRQLSADEVQAIAERVSRLRVEVHLDDGGDTDVDDVADVEPDDQ